jgi:hypothetical protein
MGNSPTPPIAPPIPPGPDGKCPQGWILNPVDGLCYLYALTNNITDTGVKLPDVDPKNAAELAGLGTGDSGLPERQALAHWHALKKMALPALPPAPSGLGVWLAKGAEKLGTNLGDLLSPLVWAYLTLYDVIVSVIASWLTESKTRDNPFFWLTIGTVMSDLLGVEVDGPQLYQDMKSRGTVAGMQGVGAALINLLIGEFTQTLTGTGGQINAIPTPDTDTGLPAATLTPRGGILAAQALMGFVLSSSVRQANIEGLTEKIPWGFGVIFEKYSEAMRTNLGIGKMLRFALRPIFQELVATPLKWAMNMEYRPTRFNAAEAARARWSGVYDQTAFLAEAAQLGYTDKRALQLLDEHTRRVDLNRALILRASGTLGDSDFDNFLTRDGYDPTHAAYTRQASDLEPARRVALALAEHYLLEFGRGNITTQALKDFIDGLKTAGFLIAPGEVAGLEAVATKISVNVKLRPRHLSPAQLHKAYIDGTITLVEYEDHLTGLGYSADDVQILGIEVLLDAKKAQAAAAKKAAAKKTGNTTAALTPPGSAPVA